MAAQVLAVVCAWCKSHVTTAPADAGVTHTICPSCFDWTMTHPGGQARPGAASDLAELRLPVGYFGDGI